MMENNVYHCAKLIVPVNHPTHKDGRIIFPGGRLHSGTDVTW
jgi:hypothetical protein